MKDKVNNDPNCGVFAVFDGHGGRQVADHCAERMCDELRKEIAKNSGDLSIAIEAVFLRVRVLFHIFRSITNADLLMLKILGAQRALQ